MNDLVSIIVPIYNSDKYVKRCIESLINQTKEEIEIILVNDGSTDNSRKIIERFNDERIIIINQNNGGVTRARMNGFKASMGSYVMFVDADDYLEENAVEVLYNALKRDNVDLVKCNQKKLINGKYVKDNLITKYLLLRKRNPIIYGYLYETICFNSICKQLIRRELLENIEINYDLKYGEDLRIMLDVIKKVNKVVFITDELYVYNINSDSFTQSNDIKTNMIKLKDSVSVYMDLYNYVDKYNISTEYKKKAIIKLLFYIVYNFFNLNTNNKSDLNIYIDESKKVIHKLNKDYSYNDIKMYNKSNIIYKIGMKVLYTKKYKKIFKYKKIYGLIKKIFK